MEIINHGNKYKAVSFRCATCGCEFKCVKGEYMIRDDYQAPGLRTFSTICPECSDDVNFNIFKPCEDKNADS